MENQKSILICQHLTCRKQGSAQILAAFRAQLPSVCHGSGCLGRCGNGPNVLVLPSQHWYHHVQTTEVPLIIQELSGTKDP